MHIFREITFGEHVQGCKCYRSIQLCENAQTELKNESLYSKKRRKSVWTLQVILRDIPTVLNEYFKDTEDAFLPSIHEKLMRRKEAPWDAEDFQVEELEASLKAVQLDENETHLKEKERRQLL